MIEFGSAYGRRGSITTTVCACDVCGKGALCIEIDSSAG